MSNQILINATHMREELRVAVVNDNIVNHLEIEAIAKQQTKAYIYKGRVSRIEPSLEACFVDYGEKRHGFLPLKDISPTCFCKEINPNDSYSIQDVVKEGQELIVQVEKIERGNKGAALTTYITLAGSYLVLMPNNPSAGGVSRRIEGEERSELLSILKNLNAPNDLGIIVRTASIGKSQEEIQWDLDVLIKLWESIQEIANTRNAPILIHQESNAIMRALRDHLHANIDEVIADEEHVYEEVKKYMELIRPDFVEKVKYYSEKIPLYRHFNIEDQVESVFRRELRLPSGGALVIDQTEALISIDINSARSTKGADIEATALHTNKEAAQEIARQLRLRDIGGLIVIDFIDMMRNENQREVEDCLRDALKNDRAKVQFGRISRFGLLEMSRQRLRSTLGESTKIRCPRCQGQGMIRAIQSQSLAILRDIEDNACKNNISIVRTHLPTESATYLLNEKRADITEIENKYGVRVLLIPHVHMESPNYEIERIHNNQTEEANTPSYQLAVEFKHASLETADMGLEEDSRTFKPALQTIDLPTKPSTRKKQGPKKPGFFAKLFASLLGTNGKKEPEKTRTRSRQSHRGGSGGGQRRRSHQNRRGGNNHRGGYQGKRGGGQRRSGGNRQSQQHSSKH
ncbi:MAG: ribonuclease E/G [Gammaproteobacteria bacterium]